MNQNLISQLNILLKDASRNQTKDANAKFKIKSYKDAIIKIKNLSEELITIDKIPLKPGKIYNKVVEFLETGQISEAKDLGDSSLDKFMDELMEITAIGPSKIKEIIEVYNITSMDQLNQHLEILNDKQRMGLKYHKFDKMRIPREEIIRHQILYNDCIDKYNIPIEFSVVGSFRREATDSGDIDILIKGKNNIDDPKLYKRFVDALIKDNYLIDNLAYGAKKYMGYGLLPGEESIPRRIDILYCSNDEFPFAQLYFTGSGEFNVKMRTYCKLLGYKLNEKSLESLNDSVTVPINIYTEKDIFDFLGLPYLKPKQRTPKVNFPSS